MNKVNIKINVDKSQAEAALRTLGTAFKGFGLVAAGALGIGIATPLLAAGIALGGFAAVAAANLGKIKAIIAPVKQNFLDMAHSMAPLVEAVARLGAQVGDALIPAVGSLARAGATVLTDFLKPLLGLLHSDFFGQFIKEVDTLASEIGPALGKTLVAIVKDLMMLVVQAGPSAIKLLKDLLGGLTDVLGGLVPFVAWITKTVASFDAWISKYPALKAVVIGLGIAIGIAVAAASDGILPLVGLIATAIGALVHLWQTSQTFRNIVTTSFSSLADAVLRAGHVMLDIWHVEADAALSFASNIVHAFALIPGPQQHAMQVAAKAVDDFKGSVDRGFDAAIAKIDSWRHTVDNLPKVVKIEGDITDLQSKLAAAVRSLKDPNLTATRKAKIEANIDQLRAAISQAKALLAQINGTTATTYVRTINTGTGHTITGQASGGIVGAATGGIHSGLRWVGEHGPELVSLPFGSTVHSNPDSMRMASGSQPQKVVIEIDLRGAGPELIKFLRKSTRGKTGGNTQLMFGHR